MLGGTTGRAVVSCTQRGLRFHGIFPQRGPGSQRFARPRTVWHTEGVLEVRPVVILVFKAEFFQYFVCIRE